MKYLPDKISPAKVNQPLLIEQSSIASAQAFNQKIKMGQIDLSSNKNILQKTVDTLKRLQDNDIFKSNQIKLAEERKLITSDKIVFGSKSPYHRADNFLYNKRTQKPTKWGV